MKDKIILEVRKMQGNLIGIGTDDELILDEIEKNDNINLCYILSNGGSGKKKFKLFKKGRSKKVNIKKLSRYFRLRSIDNILCNYNTVKKYIRSFIGESIYISNGNIYLYGDIKDLENLENKYKKFTEDIKVIKNNRSFILIVGGGKTKINIFKNTWFKIKDFFESFIDKLTDLLVN